MMIGRFALHVIRIGLCALLIVQIMQMISALQMLHGPEAFAVSPLLLAAFTFKSFFLLLHFFLLCILLLVFIPSPAASSSNLSIPLPAITGEPR